MYSNNLIFHMKAYVAEFVGTAILVIGGCGAAIFSGAYLGPLGVAIAFGLSLTLISYAFGHISGGHFNPAVTVAMTLTHKLNKKVTSMYIVSQLLGAIVGGFILFIIAQGTSATTVGFASNALLGDTSLMSGFLIEVLLTMILCLVAIETTAARFPRGFAGITLGATLTLIHLISIPLTNTSVNPARSFGVAFFAGGPAVTYLWVFFAAPVLGAVIAVYLYRFMQHPEA
jgi:aquaporin Z